MRMSTVTMELKHRRLQWWQEVIKGPEEIDQLIAALLGELRLETQMNKRTGTVPWIAQLLRDIQ